MELPVWVGVRGSGLMIKVGGDEGQQEGDESAWMVWADGVKPANDNLQLKNRLSGRRCAGMARGQL